MKAKYEATCTKASQVKKCHVYENSLITLL